VPIFAASLHKCPDRASSRLTWDTDILGEVTFGCRCECLLSETTRAAYEILHLIQQASISALPRQEIQARTLSSFPGW